MISALELLGILLFLAFAVVAAIVVFYLAGFVLYVAFIIFLVLLAGYVGWLVGGWVAGAIGLGVTLQSLLSWTFAVLFMLVALFFAIRAHFG